MRITIFALNVLIVFIYLQIANHRQMLTHYVVGSPEYKQIIDLLKAVDRLHCITAHLPMQNTNEENPKVPEDTGRPSTSSTPASHSVLHPIRLSLGRIPLYPHMHLLPQISLYQSSLHPHMHLLPQRSLHLLLRHFLT